MAEAKRDGGLYYVNGKAVDANGEEVKGAPKQPKDTPPEEIARVAAAKDPVQRLADTLDRTFGGSAHAASMAAMRGPASSNAGGEGEGKPITVNPDELPTLEELPDFVQTLGTAKEVNAYKKADKRVGAKPIYQARLAELDQDEDAEE